MVGITINNGARVCYISGRGRQLQCDDASEFFISPLFVSLSPDMLLTDHDGVPCRTAGT